MGCQKKRRVKTRLFLYVKPETLRDPPASMDSDLRGRNQPGLRLFFVLKVFYW